MTHMKIEQRVVASWPKGPNNAVVTTVKNINGTDYVGLREVWLKDGPDAEPVWTKKGCELELKYTPELISVLLSETTAMSPEEFEKIRNHLNRIGRRIQAEPDVTNIRRDTIVAWLRELNPAEVDAIMSEL